MSASVTTTELRDTLRDYEIHLTGAQDLPSSSPTPQQQQAPQSSTNWVPLLDHAAPDVENPADWDHEHRGVPQYRPINTGMDMSMRPWGGDPVGTAFVFTMFTGVWLQATLSWTWRKTVGRYNKTLFRYKVGGEF